jgi:ABC-2 type transport system ATP-binding protein
MPPALELRELTKDYGSVRALDLLTLAVEEGEIMGFLGPNGAGKTTAIRILFDLIHPTSGSASVQGFDCQKQSLQARALMGYLPGEVNLYEDLTGRQTIDYVAGLRSLRTEQSFVTDLIERLQLDPSRRVGAYSKGNLQKLGLVLAMMYKPPIVVLDEPTSGLDPIIQDEVASLLFDLTAEGKTVFFSSHVLSEVERMCHRAAFLRNGKLVALEDVSQVKARSLHILEVTFESAPPPSTFQIDGVQEVDRSGDTVHLEVRDNLDAVIKALRAARRTGHPHRTTQPGPGVQGVLPRERGVAWRDRGSFSKRCAICDGRCSGTAPAWH